MVDERTDRAGEIQRLLAERGLVPTQEQRRAEIEALPPAAQCAVLGHQWPDAWDIVNVPARDQHPAVWYYRRNCPRCTAMEVRSGRWPA